MKAEELMIGDWVRQKFSGLHLRVHSITPPYILAYGEEGRFHEDSIEPIPITPEILEKNGFERNETHISTDFDLVMDGVDIFIIIFDDGDIVVDIEKNIVDGVNRLHHCEIKYVHQLQQAMRLCGINKEIEL